MLSWKQNEENALKKEEVRICIIFCRDLNKLRLRNNH